MMDQHALSENAKSNWERTALYPRDPLPCPHDDCLYRDGLVGGRPGMWFRLNELDCVALVDAIENNHPHRVSLLIKRQTWYPSMAKQMRENQKHE